MQRDQRERPALSIGEAAEEVSRLTGAPQPHSSTVRRWSTEGVRGHRLRTAKVGVRRYVKPKDLVAFLAALNAVEALR